MSPFALGVTRSKKVMPALFTMVLTATVATISFFSAWDSKCSAKESRSRFGK